MNSAGDLLFIRDLKLSTRVGVHDWEKHAQQPLLLNLELGTDTARAASSGQLADTIDYAAVADRIRELLSANTFTLVETLAEQVAQTILDSFPIAWISLRVEKLDALPDAEGVGISIKRQR